MPSRLVIICQRFPYPARRGDQLAVSKLIESAVEEKIEVICYFVSGASCVQKTGVEFIQLKFSIRSCLRQLHKAMFQPLQLTLFCGYRVNVLSDDDVIYIHTIRLSNSIPVKKWAQASLAPQIDFSAEFMERSSSSSNLLFKAIFALEAFLIRRWQRRNFPLFRKLFRVVNTEFQDYSDVNFITSPHGFKASRVTRDLRPRESKTRFTIGFWGNLAFQPNIDACIKLLAELGDDNRFVILIFGQHSDAVKTQVRNVKLLGAVDSVDEHIKDCDAMLNLIKTGGGFQNKTIEAWAQGIPVFGYEQAFRGLSGISNIIKNYENADKLYTDLLAIDRASFSKLSTDWILENWNEEKNAKAKLMELGFKL